jgi:hypothetical protein
VLGHGIINGGSNVARAVSEMVGVDLEGTPYWRLCVFKIISSSLVRGCCDQLDF